MENIPPLKYLCKFTLTRADFQNAAIKSNLNFCFLSNFGNLSKSATVTVQGQGSVDVTKQNIDEISDKIVTT
jgi:hypothetical protein